MAAKKTSLDEQDLDRYGVWVKAGPDNIDEQDDTNLDLMDIEDSDHDELFITEEEEKLLGVLEKSTLQDFDNFDESFSNEDEFDKPIPQEQAALNITEADLDGESKELLYKIEEELNTLRGEIRLLKDELTELKAPGALADHDGFQENGGFFDEEKDNDETIALTDDELDNILDSADMKEEMGDPNTDTSIEEIDPALAILSSPEGSEEFEAESDSNEIPGIDEEVNLDAIEETPIEEEPIDSTSAASTELENSELDPAESIESLPSEDDIDLENLEYEDIITEPIEDEFLYEDEVALSESGSFDIADESAMGDIEMEETSLDNFDIMETEEDDLLTDAAPGNDAAASDVLAANVNGQTDFEDIDVEADEVRMSQDIEENQFDEELEFESLGPEQGLADEEIEEIDLDETVNEDLENIVIEETTDEDISSVIDAMPNIDSEEDIDFEDLEIDLPDELSEGDITVAVPNDDFGELPGTEEVDIEALGNLTADPALTDIEEETIADLPEEPMTTAPESEEKPEDNPIEAQEPDKILGEDLKNDIKEVLKYMDELLESLPDNKIQEFAQSELFGVYKKIFEELGISD